jgi:hypothetical protein
MGRPVHGLRMAVAADLQSVERSMKDYVWKDGGEKIYSSKLKSPGVPC